jgi:hypothetical protein
VDLIGEDILGITKNDIGLHSIRSGGAMAMFLSGTSVVIIMRVGRWSSEAFLEYIREQVENFTTGVSQNMLAFECYFVLGRNNNNTASSKKYPQKSSQNNESGPIEVPFDVSFSNMAINDSAGLTKSFGRR